jgi:hypothetical protein
VPFIVVFFIVVAPFEVRFPVISTAFTNDAFPDNKNPRFPINFPPTSSSAVYDFFVVKNPPFIVTDCATTNVLPEPVNATLLLAVNVPEKVFAPVIV